jgi:hypothetical protein
MVRRDYFTDDFNQLLLLLLVEQEGNDSAKTFGEQLTLQSRCCRQGKIWRDALLHPSQSSFQHLFNSGQDDTLITLCGFDHISFASLHSRFKPLFDNYLPYKRQGQCIVQHNTRKAGRRLLNSIQCLALVLAWTRTRSSMAVLEILFGITSGHLSLGLRFGQQLLFKVLRADQHAIVSMPSEEEVDDFIGAINMKYPALTNCWGAMDGLKVRLEKAGNSQIQNIFFNGWTHDHYISNLFLFSPDGKIRACYINAPGTLHDSTMANWGGLYEQYRQPGKC